MKGLPQSDHRHNQLSTGFGGFTVGPLRNCLSGYIVTNRESEGDVGKHPTETLIQMVVSIAQGARLAQRTGQPCL
jgi:hypothetical protein